VVVNNGGYREIREQQARRGIAPIGVDLFTPDLARVARAFGATGVTARDAGQAAELAAAAARGSTPTLIQVMG